MVANFATNALSMVSGQLAEMIGGGQLAKLELNVLNQEESKVTKAQLVLPINPESIKVTLPSRRVQASTTGVSEETQQETVQPRVVTFDAHFDTYEQRKDVRTAYIDTLAEFSRPQEQMHKKAALQVVWGKFKTNWASTLESFDVTYTMFLPDGTPVRCKVSLKLTEIQDANDYKLQSPDHAKMHVVQRGDTLQRIAFQEYDDVSEWRRIADANGIEDPMNLEPGTKLLVPPILR